VRSAPRCLQALVAPVVAPASTGIYQGLPALTGRLPTSLAPAQPSRIARQRLPTDARHYPPPPPFPPACPAPLLRVSPVPVGDGRYTDRLAVTRTAGGTGGGASCSSSGWRRCASSASAARPRRRPPVNTPAPRPRPRRPRRASAYGRRWSRRPDPAPTVRRPAGPACTRANGAREASYKTVGLMGIQEQK
jgi:hypothetical protein